jgi:hypothetical protein
LLNRSRPGRILSDSVSVATMRRTRRRRMLFWLWLRHLLIWADDRPLTKAAGIRPVYPRHLVTAKSGAKGNKSLATIGVTRCCQEARSFFHRARQTDQRQYRDVTAVWVETLYPPRMDVEPRKDHQAVTIEMVRDLCDQGFPRRLPGIRSLISHSANKG